MSKIELDNFWTAPNCCKFWPVFGYCAHQTLVETYFLNVFLWNFIFYKYFIDLCLLKFQLVNCYSYIFSLHFPRPAFWCKLKNSVFLLNFESNFLFFLPFSAFFTKKLWKSSTPIAGQNIQHLTISLNLCADLINTKQVK